MLAAAPPQPQVTRPLHGADHLERLPQGWAILPGKLLHFQFAGTRPRNRRLVLLHPGIGIAVIDLLPPDALPVSTGEAEATVAELREKLEAVEFGCAYPGHLPAVHFGLRETDVSVLGSLLSAAFATEAPISLPPDSNWVDAATRALSRDLEVPIVAASDHPVAANENNQSAPGRADPRPSDPAVADNESTAKSRRMRWKLATAALAAAAAGVAVLLHDSRGEAVDMREATHHAAALLATPPESLPAIADAEAAAAEPADAGNESLPPPALATGPDAATTAVDSTVRLANLSILAAPPVLLAQAALPEGPVAEPSSPQATDAPPERAPAPAPEAASEPIPEPDAARPGSSMAEQAASDTARTAVEPLPEPDAPRLGDLEAEAPRPVVATPAEPLPEPDALRASDLEAEAPRPVVAAPAEPLPEPDALRAGDLRAEESNVAVAAPSEPLPEPDGLRAGDLAAEATAPANAGAPAPASTPTAPPADVATAQQPAPAAVAPSPQPAPVVATAPPTPAAPPVSTPAPAAAARPAPLDPRVVQILLARGQEMFARGDVSGARLLFRRAAEGGSAEGARELGRSYDPSVLARIGARGIQPDPAQAALWYRRADELGGTR